MSSTEQVFGRAFAYGGGAGKSAAEFWRDYSKGLTHEQRLAQVRFVARMMDDQFRVPGTNLRFGLDLVRLSGVKRLAAVVRFLPAQGFEIAASSY